MLLLFHSLIPVKLIAWPGFLVHLIACGDLYSNQLPPIHIIPNILPVVYTLALDMRRWRVTCSVYSSSV